MAKSNCRASESTGDADPLPPKRQSRGGEKSVSPKANLAVSGTPEDPTTVSAEAAVKPVSDI